jgi:hypothetical protein
MPEGLATSALATPLGSKALSIEPMTSLGLPPFSGDSPLPLGEAAFCETPMLSDKLSRPSRSLVYYNGVSEYSCIVALLNGDPLMSFLDSDVFTF